MATIDAILESCDNTLHEINLFFTRCEDVNVMETVADLFRVQESEMLT